MLHTYNPLTNDPTKYQLLATYSFRDCNSPDKILYVKVTMDRSKVKSRSHQVCCTYPPPNQCPYQVSTSNTLWFPRYSPDKLLEVKVTTARSKVKSRSHHDVAYLHPLTNVPTKYYFLHLTVSQI